MNQRLVFDLRLAGGCAALIHPTQNGRLRNVGWISESASTSQTNVGAATPFKEWVLLKKSAEILITGFLIQGVGSRRVDKRSASTIGSAA